MACALGIPGIEVDVRFTADSIPVLMHDRDVRRTSSGAGNVDQMTLWKMRAGVVQDRAFRWVRLEENQNLVASVLRTDMDSRPGDSGGPVVNARGELIAVTSGGTDGQVSLAVDVPRLTRLFKETRPDVVHVNNGGFPGAISCTAAAMRVMSASVAASLSARLPMTYMRNAEWPIYMP